MIGMRWDFDGRINRLLNRRIHEKTGENNQFSTNFSIIKSGPNKCRLPVGGIGRSAGDAKYFDRSVLRFICSDGFRM